MQQEYTTPHRHLPLQNNITIESLINSTLSFLLNAGSCAQLGHNFLVLILINFCNKVFRRDSQPTFKFLLFCTYKVQNLSIFALGKCKFRYSNEFLYSPKCLQGKIKTAYEKPDLLLIATYFGSHLSSNGFTGEGNRNRKKRHQIYYRQCNKGCLCFRH